MDCSIRGWIRGQPEGDNSVIGVPFFFFLFLERSRFWGRRVGARRAWRWWIGESRAELFSWTKHRHILLYRRSCSNSTYACFTVFFITACYVWQSMEFLVRTYFLSSPHREICRFPKCIANTEARLEKAGEQFFIPKDHLPAEDLKPARNRWQDRWFPRARTSRAQLFLGNGKSSRTWKNSWPTSSFLARLGCQSREGGRFSWECIKIRMINRWRYIYFFS